MAAIPDGNKDREKYLQKGLWEKLLCRNCEARIQPWEDHAARVLKKLPDTQQLKPGELLQVPVDYCKFKLFQLSLIWRMGVSSNPAFNAVKLGSNHQSILRSMLSDGRPGGKLEYPCLLLTASDPWKVKCQIIKLPHRSRLQSHVVYLLVAYGCIWMFFISSHAHKIREVRSFLGEDGELPVHVFSGSWKKFADSIWRNIT